jgi:hypothetical protein
MVKKKLADPVQLLYRVLCALLARPESFIFREPVEWERDGLTDYPNIVKRPMDLGTVKKNMEEGKYETVEEVARDIRQVWTNCMAYNQDGSEYYHLADIFAAKFETVYADIKAKCGLISTSNREGRENLLQQALQRVPSLEDKLQFSYEVFKLGKPQLAHVLTVLEDRCPSAMSRRVHEDEVLIQVDMIPNETLNTLELYLDEHLRKGKRRASEPVDRASKKAR